MTADKAAEKSNYDDVSLVRRVFADVVTNFNTKVEKPVPYNERPWWKVWFLDQRLIPIIVDPDNHDEKKQFQSFKSRYDIQYARTPLFGNDLLIGNGPQSVSPCNKIEKDALECIEYYGYDRGLKICKDYYDDFAECAYGYKRKLREFAIMDQRNKRYKEYVMGKRDYSTVYADIPNPLIFRKIGLTPKHNYGD